MKRIFAFLLLTVFCIGLQPSTKAQDTLVPAGTLIRCTLDEPNFSSATVSPGDPVVCHLSSLQIYGRNVFPRGSYLGGHLEAAKEPGHFVGKGYLQLQFDRIGFPNTDIPVPSKVIAAKGFKVDKQGDIVGHGHATRDIVEWMIPPLWPWKILTLPARGPRPTLKPEEQITLRLMDDIVVPRVVAAAERPPVFYHPQPSYDRPANYRPRTYTQPSASNVPASLGATGGEVVANGLAADNHQAQPILASPAVMAATPASVSVASETNIILQQDAQRLTIIALKSGALLTAASYRIDDGIVNYLTAGGVQNAVDSHDVDWRRTTQLNLRHPETSVAVTLPHAY